MMTTMQRKQYFQLRREGWHAQYAYRHVIADGRLRVLEDDEWVRFEWVDDYDYQPDGDYDLEDERDKLARQVWFACGCILQLPERDSMVGWRTGGWVNDLSLWGIVGPYDQSDAAFRRSIELNLAYEVGLL